MSGGGKRAIECGGSGEEGRGRSAGLGPGDGEGEVSGDRCGLARVPLPAVLSTELGQDFQCPLAAGLNFLGTGWRRSHGRRQGLGRLGRGVELNLADVQILFEAVELEEVGEFQRPNVSASFADLALEIANDSLEIVLVEARMEELIPEPFPIKTQAQALAGQTAIQRVSLLDALDHGWLRLRPVNPGTCSMASCMV